MRRGAWVPYPAGCNPISRTHLRTIRAYCRVDLGQCGDLGDQLGRNVQFLERRTQILH